MKEKFISFFITLILIISSVGIAQEDTLKVVGTSGDIGTTENIIQIDLINQYATQTIQGLQFTLSCPAYIKFLSATKTERTVNFDVQTSWTELTGTLIIVMSSTMSTIFPDSGSILDINFEIKATAVPGNYSLTLSNVIAAAPGQGEGVPLVPVNGIITIEGEIVPVELNSFNAAFETESNAVVLFWATRSEKNNFGFEIQKSTDQNQFNKIAFVPGSGTSVVAHEYSYRDHAVNSGKSYYRLKQIDLDGRFSYSSTVEIEIAPPNKYALAQNYPNPFSIKNQNQHTIISFQLPQSALVEIKIFDLLGREVRTLVSRTQPQGIHSQIWDGKNNAGQSVATGVYYYQMKANNFRQVKKMLILE